MYCTEFSIVPKLGALNNQKFIKPEMWWLSTPDFWGPAFESGISNKGPDGLLCNNVKISGYAEDDKKVIST